MSRFTAKERLTRLLAVIPHVAGHGFVPVDEVATRFGYPRQELLADLDQAVQFVGVAPFTPDTMIEVIIEGDHVRIDYADWFARPLRLTSQEALALLTAGRTLGGLDRDDEAAGPLLRGLTKLGAMLGEDPGDALDIVLGTAPEQMLAELRQAIAERRAVRIDHYSYGRDRRHMRVIEPHHLFADAGHWYVGAHCRLAGGSRVFRVDRIRAVELLDETFRAPTDPGDAVAFSPDPDAPRVVVDLAPDARWVRDQYPHEHAEDLEDGRLRLTLAVGARTWLERLLVRLGDQVEVVELPEDWDPDPRAVAARRILARYGVPHE